MTKITMKKIFKDEFIRLLRRQPVCLWGGKTDRQEVLRIDLNVTKPLWAVLWRLDGRKAMELADFCESGSDSNGMLPKMKVDYVEAANDAEVVVVAANGNMETLQLLQPWAVEADPTVKGTVELDDY